MQALSGEACYYTRTGAHAQKRLEVINGTRKSNI